MQSFDVLLVAPKFRIATGMLRHSLRPFACHIVRKSGSHVAISAPRAVIRHVSNSKHPAEACRRKHPNPG